MGVFSETFGATGSATTFFGGQWWIVGLFLLIIFITFLAAYRVSSYGITLFTIFGFLSIGSYQLYMINEQIVQTIMFIIFMFVGFMAYRFFSK